MADSLPSIRIQNTGGTQINVPFSLGHVFAPGHLQPSDGLKGLQVDVKATHADGSVRHAILSGVLPALKAGETVTVPLVKAARQEFAGVDMRGLSLPDAKVNLVIGGEKYTAIAGWAGFGNYAYWLAGPVVLEGFVSALLVNAAGAEHPNLTARFGLRYYPGAKQARVEIIVENTKTWAPGVKLTYDVELQLNGETVFSCAALEHYHHSRWHQYFWAGAAPQIHIQHDTAYLIKTQAVPNYDQSLRVSESILSEMANYLTAENTGPMKIGTSLREMGTTGGRGDIGPLPDNAVIYLLSADKRAGDVMIANADGSGSWSIHYRDEHTGYPLRTDNDANKDITLHLNYKDRGPLPVPRTVTDLDGATPYSEDPGHEPSLVYLPYLLTGEQYYLEELHFWAVFNPLGTAPGNHGNGQGLLRWHQVRGQAWAMRTLGHAAYITPDASPMKAYFNQQLDNNLNFYNTAYVIGNPNKLGVYDGSGENSFYTDHSAPWQDDFFTWSFGYLSELGFTKAEPILKWKAKYSVGRMTDPKYCWIQAAAYQLKFRDNDSSPIYDTFDKLYQANFNIDPLPNENGVTRQNPLGKYIDQPCGSQAQANWLGAANGYEWIVGRMTGYADSVLGYPANMQPALAVAADSGIDNAMKAWTVFDGRTLKPDYSRNPQWNVIPRSVVQPAAAAPAPVQISAVQLSAAPGNGTWAKAGAENSKISLPIASRVRYGAEGKGYVYATTLVKDFTANNAVFGSDPAVNVVKQVDVFTPAKPVTLKTPGNTLLKKLTGLVVKAVDPKTLQIVSKLSGVTAASTGIITVSSADLTAKSIYAVVVEDAAGKVIDIMFPVTATA